MNVKNPLIIKLSTWFSNLMNPLISLVLYFFYLNNFAENNISHPKRLLLALLLVILPIAGWIFYNVKVGNYTNMDVSNQKQRRTLYYFIYAVVAFFVAVQYFFYDSVDIEATFLLVLLLMMGFSNYLIKSSMHTAFNLFVAALYFSHNTTLGIIWLCITFVVGITRLILKRHSLSEVLMGAFIGSVVSIAYLYTQIQIQHTL